MDNLNLPPRIFAACHEPVGERVNSNHKIKKTKAIIDALEPEELEFLQNSTFGKIIAIDENPPFSGASGQYVVVRLLKVNKKYEVWFLFAGNPIRMSLREFAIVTGLNCAKLPEPTKKKKNPLKEKIYWNELFGSLKFCTLDIVIDMLKKKVVKSREARIKFACLAITSSILFPSSHQPRIIPEHVELIRDLDEFLDFPWGRASFQSLVTSIVAKDELTLAQSSVAVRGYVDAIQLVLLAEIPQLKEEISHTEPVVIVELESAASLRKKCCHQKMTPRMQDEPYEEWSTGLDLTWADETGDDLVDNMVRLIGEGFAFRKEMFKGGLTSADLTPPTDLNDLILALERRIVRVLGAKIDNLLASSDDSHQVALIQTTVSTCLQNIETKLGKVILDQLKIMESAVIKGVIDAIAKNGISLNMSVEDLTRGESTAAVHSSDNSSLGADPTGPPEPVTTQDDVTDCRINEVLRDLNQHVGVFLHEKKDTSPHPDCSQEKNHELRRELRE
ncbi:hypothetical protein Bca101_088697 [Brassica carinata]